MVPSTLIVGKEEQLVMEDWSTEGAAKDVTGERVLCGRSGGAVLVDPRICVQVVVGKVVERTSMPLVGAALGLVENIAAEHVSILSRRIGRDDLDLADRIHAWVIAGDIVEGGVEIHAVEQVLVRLL